MNDLENVKQAVSGKVHFGVWFGLCPDGRVSYPKLRNRWTREITGFASPIKTESKAVVLSRKIAGTRRY